MLSADQGIAVAIAEPDGAVRSLGTIPNRVESIRKMVKKLGTVDQLRACYASVAVYRNEMFNPAGDASTPPEALYGLRVTANLFPTLGVTPMLGRNILPDEY